MDLDEAFAIAFANLKLRRRKELIRTAQALRRIKQEPQYKSNGAVGQAVGVSGEIVREFLALLELPTPIQQALAENRLNLEHGRRLYQLGRRRNHSLLDRVGSAMEGLTAFEGRDLVDHILRHPELSVEQAKQAVLDAKTVHEREFAVVALLPEEPYRRLQALALSRSRSVNELVTEMVMNVVGAGFGQIH